MVHDHHRKGIPPVDCIQEVHGVTCGQEREARQVIGGPLDVSSYLHGCLCSYYGKAFTPAELAGTYDTIREVDGIMALPYPLHAPGARRYGINVLGG